MPQALTPTSIDGTVLTAAIESANPAMATKVLDSVQENISDPQQVKQPPPNAPSRCLNARAMLP